MTNFSIMLRSFREREGLSQTDLAKLLGVSKQSISMYELGKREPDFVTEERIADILGVDLDTLRGRDSSGKDSVKLKVLGRVAAGIPIEMITDIVDEEEISAQMASVGEYFALRIKGKSMEPVINDGDNVIVKKQPDVDSGDIAIVTVNGEDATCKMVKKTAAGVILMPKNPSFEPLFFTNEEVVSKPVTILGKVVELRRKL